MAPTKSSSASTGEAARLLASGFRFLRFPEPLESEFRAEHRARLREWCAHDKDRDRHAHSRGNRSGRERLEPPREQDRERARRDRHRRGAQRDLPGDGALATGHSRGMLSFSILR